MNAARLSRYLRAGRDPQVWRRTLVLGLPVGLLQATLNQGDHWWRQHIDALLVAKTLLCPLFSCSIAFVSAVATHAAKTLDSSSS